MYTYIHIHHFLRFRAGVKDLEVMVQNLICSAFETVTTVQEGVEILDIFQHLSSREVCTKCMNHLRVYQGKGVNSILIKLGG